MIEGSAPALDFLTRAVAHGMDIGDLIVLYAIGGDLAETSAAVLGVTDVLSRPEVYFRTSRLTDRGYLRAHRDKDNKSLVVLSLTTKGRNAAREMIESYAKEQTVR